MCTVYFILHFQRSHFRIFAFSIFSVAVLQCCSVQRRSFLLPSSFLLVNQSHSHHTVLNILLRPHKTPIPKPQYLHPLPHIHPQSVVSLFRCFVVGSLPFVLRHRRPSPIIHSFAREFLHLHPRTHSPTHSPTHSLTRSLPGHFNQSLTQSVSHSLTQTLGRTDGRTVQ